MNGTKRHRSSSSLLIAAAAARLTSPFWEIYVSCLSSDRSEYENSAEKRVIAGGPPSPDPRRLEKTSLSDVCILAVWKARRLLMPAGGSGRGATLLYGGCAGRRLGMLTAQPAQPAQPGTKVPFVLRIAGSRSRWDRAPPPAHAGCDAPRVCPGVGYARESKQHTAQQRSSIQYAACDNND